MAGYKNYIFGADSMFLVDPSTPDTPDTPDTSDSEKDTQKTMDFSEYSTTVVGGHEYKVHTGNGLVSTVEDLSALYPESTAEYVSYSMKFAPSWRTPTTLTSTLTSTLTFKNIQPDSAVASYVVAAPEPATPKGAPKWAGPKLKLSPHSKFTKDILRRPNKYGK